MFRFLAGQMGEQWCPSMTLGYWGGGNGLKGATFGRDEFEVLVGYLNGYDKQAIRHVEIQREC